MIPSEHVAPDICQVCSLPAHGKHFGIHACRACAAFFRRYHNVRSRPVRTLICRKANHDCGPSANGRWYCKQCRLDKCIQMGMSPDNIQYDRDIASTSSGFTSAKGKLKRREKIPNTVERAVGKPLLVLWLQKEEKPKRLISFFDFNEILDKLPDIFQKTSDSSPALHANSLQKLTRGLRDIRKLQKSEDLVDMKTLGRVETMSAWENGIVGVATWLAHCDEFRKLTNKDKIALVKCIWSVFSTFERIAMTAEMRSRNLCGASQFVVSHDEIVNFESSTFEVEWLSDLPLEKLEFFLGPVESWYKTHLIDDLMAIRPTETEVTFALASLCFQLTGADLGAGIQEYTERMQEVLANDLHGYYAVEYQANRYSHRLVKLLKVVNEYKRTMNRRRNNVTVGYCMDVFTVDFSHPEMFRHAV